MFVRVKHLRRNKNGVLQLRVSVPKELRAKAGKAEKFWSLGTKDDGEALKRLPQKQAEAAAYLASLRDDSAVLSPSDAERLANRWLSAALARDEAERRAQDYPASEEGNEPPEVRGLDAYADMILDQAGHDGDFSSVSREVQEALSAERIVLVPGSDSYKRLESAVLLAKVKLLRAQHERSFGRWTMPVAAEAASTETPTLREAHRQWVAQRPRTATVLSDWKNAVEMFVSLHGDLRVAEVRKLHIAAFRDKLLTDTETPRAPATVRKLVGCLQSVLQKQVDDGVVDFNPATGVKVATSKNAPKAREDFTIDELKLIFASPVFSLGVRPTRAGGEAAYWVFVLALFTGARLGELTQLDVVDVKREEGVWFLFIHDLDEGKSLKTTNSRRIVPLHNNVIALGFDRYVASLDAAGRLFPTLRNVGKRLPSQRFSRWANELIDDVGIVDKRLTFHSLRHTFITACRRAEIGEDIHQRLTGHVSGNVGRTYGKAEVQTLKNAVDQIEFGDLVVPVWQPGSLQDRYERPRAAKRSAD